MSETLQTGWWSRRDLNPGESPANLSFFGPKRFPKWLFRYSLPHVGQTPQCACAKLHLVSDSGLRRVGCDETHELISRWRWSVRAVGIRTADFVRDDMARHTVGERRDGAGLESRLGGEAFVALMKPANLRNRDHLAAVWRLDAATIRAVFVEREMCPGAVVIVNL